MFHDLLLAAIARPTMKACSVAAIALAGTSKVASAIRRSR
jgi:hypothetical protein